MEYCGTAQNCEKGIRFLLFKDLANSFNSKIENISFISEQTASASEEVTASAEEITATMEELTKYSNELLQVLAEQLGNQISKFKIN